MPLLRRGAPEERRSIATRSGTLPGLARGAGRVSCPRSRGLHGRLVLLSKHTARYAGGLVDRRSSDWMTSDRIKILSRSIPSPTRRIDHSSSARSPAMEELVVRHQVRISNMGVRIVVSALGGHHGSLSGSPKATSPAPSGPDRASPVSLSCVLAFLTCRRSPTALNDSTNGLHALPHEKGQGPGRSARCMARSVL